MIAWKYIDKTAATIAAVRDFENMASIISYTPKEVKALRERMTSPRTARISETPSVRNPLAGEDRLVSQIDTLDLMRER